MENNGGVNLRYIISYIISAYTNITMYLPVQLLYADKFLKDY
jgi:hypothetical protein